LARDTDGFKKYIYENGNQKAGGDEAGEKMACWDLAPTLTFLVLLFPFLPLSSVSFCVMGVSGAERKA
jgi:hypothetical protein